MTWDEFKKLVDDELQKRGYDGAAEILVIEVSYPTEQWLRNLVRIEIDEDIVELSIY